MVNTVTVKGVGHCNFLSSPSINGLSLKMPKLRQSFSLPLCKFSMLTLLLCSGSSSVIIKQSFFSQAPYVPPFFSCFWDLVEERRALCELWLEVTFTVVLMHLDSVYASFSLTKKNGKSFVTRMANDQGTRIFSWQWWIMRGLTNHLIRIVLHYLQILCKHFFFFDHG